MFVNSTKDSEKIAWGGESGFLDEFRLQFHRSKTLDFAIDVMVAVDETYVSHLYWIHL